MDDEPAPLPISAASAFINPAAQTSSPAPAAPASRQAPTAAATSGPFDGDFFGSPAPAPAAAAPRSAFASSPAAVTPNLTGARSPPTASKVSFVDDASAELGNKQLQLDNTTKSVTSIQSQRQDLSTAVSTGASSLAEIESRLAQARATHESESKLVADLQERQRVQNESLKTSREELIRAESDLSALKAEKDEVEQAVMRDREDVRDLQRRMTTVQNETAELKTQLEKLKKEARQKKGMVAIGKKQLASAEGEKEKVEQEIKAVEAGDVESEDPQPIAATSESPAAAAASATSPESATGALSPSSVRSLNPFDRAGSGAGERGHSPSASLSTAAGAGAAVGLAGAAVAHEVSSSHPETDNTQAEATSQSHVQGSSSSGFDDAFGVPTSSEKEVSSSAAPAFDDDFGSGFDSGAATSTSKEAVMPGGSSTAFDDAFADFGDSQPTENNVAAASASQPEPEQPSVSDGFEESFAPVEAPSSIEQAQPSSTSDAIPTSEPISAPPQTEDQVSTPVESTPVQDEDSEDDVPLSETSAAKRKSRALDASDLSQSSTPAQQDDAGEDSSDDEADEPEDLDSQPHRSRGISNATATPGNIGDEVESVAAPASRPTLAPAESANQASDRFPELPSVEDEPSTAMPGSIGAVPPTSIVTQSPSQPDVSGGLDSSTSTTSMFSSNPLPEGSISRRDSDAGDDFHDAFDEAPQSSGSEAFPDSNGNTTFLTAGALGGGQSASGAGSTFSNISQQGSESGHERYSTAIGDGLGASAATTSGSDFSSTTLPAVAGSTPASSLAAKTRRAPPPAPVRNPSSLTPTGGAGTAQLSNDPFAPSSSAPSTNQFDSSQQSTSFDDFDSAFEDLGASSGTQSSNANAGFDDAFGGDSDFDFVPSFASSNPAQVGAPQIGSANSAFDGFGSGSQPSSNTNNANSFAGFDDFDSAFNPDGTANNVAQNSTSNSNSGSGFSFEDAFDPSAASAPSLPARNSTANAQQAAPAVQSSTAPSTQSENALPDDAGQVKQLCGMGFSRSKVIKALEKSNYRTEKALERLLAEA